MAFPHHHHPPPQRSDHRIQPSKSSTWEATDADVIHEWLGSSPRPLNNQFHASYSSPLAHSTLLIYVTNEEIRSKKVSFHVVKNFHFHASFNHLSLGKLPLMMMIKRNQCHCDYDCLVGGRGRRRMKNHSHWLSLFRWQFYVATCIRWQMDGK